MIYELLNRQIQALLKAGKIPRELTREERISWAYGNASIDNPNVTRAMCEAAVDKADQAKAAVCPGCGRLCRASYVERCCK